jgi:cytoskeletal protein CcmA (bactofilin family)
MKIWLTVKHGVIGEQMAIGRISGPLLKENLTRDGVDLAFETNLLYLDVNNSRVGINVPLLPNGSPDISEITADLTVNGKTKTTNLIVDNEARIADFIITGSSINTTNNILNLTASIGEATVYQNLLEIDDISISGNTISTINSSADLILDPNGSGKVVVDSDMDINGNLNVTGNISATGDITIGGNIVIGDNPAEDTVTFRAEIDSDLIPSDDKTYDLGSLSKRWNVLYSDSLDIDTVLTIGTFTFSGNTISSTSNIIFDTAPGYATIFNSILSVDDIEISGNLISTVVSNSSLQIRSNGTGTIELESNTNIQGNLSVTGDVNATGNVVIGGNIIIGDESTDTLQINAQIESDLIPENDNFYAIGEPGKRWRDIYTVNFYTSEIDTPSLTIGNLIFNQNSITSTQNQNIVINAGGTGGVRLGNFRFVNNTITNISTNSISVIQQSGIGYLSIVGTNGFVVPLGSTGQRPTTYAVEGMTRYNTDTRALEVWNGFTWASPAGALGAVSESLANDIAAAFAIALG